MKMKRTKFHQDEFELFCQRTQAHDGIVRVQKVNSVVHRNFYYIIGFTHLDYKGHKCYVDKSGTVLVH